MALNIKPMMALEHPEVVKKNIRKIALNDLQLETTDFHLDKNDCNANDVEQRKKSHYDLLCFLKSKLNII